MTTRPPTPPALTDTICELVRHGWIYTVVPAQNHKGYWRVSIRAQHPDTSDWLVAQWDSTPAFGKKYWWDFGTWKDRPITTITKVKSIIEKEGR